MSTNKKKKKEEEEKGGRGIGEKKKNASLCKLRQKM